MRRTAAWGVLLAVPALAHAPELAGLVSSNPLFFVSGLGHVTSAPLLDGSPGWIDPNVGFTTQALGREAARQWLHGQIPWWNHFAGLGVPLAAEMQGAALFLPFVLLLAAFDGVLYLKIILQLVGGFACFALLRQLGCTRRVSLLGGILFELNGTFAWIGHGPMLPVSFLPLILLGIERARGDARPGWLLLAIGTAYSFYAGFPETSGIYLLLAVAWAVWRVFGAPDVQRRDLAMRLLSGGLCGVLLAAPSILPFLQYLTLADIGGHARHLPGLAAVSPATFLLPSLLGPPSYDWKWVQWGQSGGFVGLPLAAIASLALRRGVRDLGLRIMLALWCVAALAISAGVIPFPHEIWFALYAVPSWIMAVIVLAAFTLDDWQRGEAVPWRALAWASAAWSAAAAAAVVLAWPAMRHVQADHPAFFIFPAATICATAIVGAVCVRHLAARCTTASITLICGLLGAQVLALALLPLLSGARGASYDKAAVRFLQTHLGQSRFFTLGPFAPNYGSFFAVASINHNLLPVPSLWVAYTRAHLDPAADAVSFTGTFPPGAIGGETRAGALRHRLGDYAALGVKYVLAAPDSNPLGVPPIFADDTVSIYELTDSAPYAQTLGGPCALVTVSRDEFRAACQAQAQLLRRELFFPGWRARVRGVDIPIAQVGGVFQGVWLPAGNSTIVFSYAPPGIGWAYACFILGLLWPVATRWKTGGNVPFPPDPPSLISTRP